MARPHPGVRGDVSLLYGTASTVPIGRLEGVGDGMFDLRDEALQLLDKRGAILDVAREVSATFRDAKVDAAIIGGVAVVLHGYVRTTMDVDVFVPGALDDAAAALRGAGFKFHRARREFRKGGVPVHFVSTGQARPAPTHFEEIEEVRVASLQDMIALKLTLGSRDPLRAIDIADVIGLIRARRLTPAFAARLPKSVRADFRVLARAVARRG